MSTENPTPYSHLPQPLDLREPETPPIAEQTEVRPGRFRRMLGRLAFGRQQTPIPHDSQNFEESFPQESLPSIEAQAAGETRDISSEAGRTHELEQEPAGLANQVKELVTPEAIAAQKEHLQAAFEGSSTIHDFRERLNEEDLTARRRFVQATNDLEKHGRLTPGVEQTLSENLARTRADINRRDEAATRASNMLEQFTGAAGAAPVNVIGAEDQRFAPIAAALTQTVPRLREQHFYSSREIESYQKGAPRLRIEGAQGKPVVSVPLRNFVTADGFTSWEEGRGPIPKDANSGNSDDLMKHYADLPTPVPPLDRVDIYVQPNGVAFMGASGGSHRAGAAIMRFREGRGPDSIQAKHATVYVIADNVFPRGETVPPPEQ